MPCLLPCYPVSVSPRVPPTRKPLASIGLGEWWTRQVDIRTLARIPLEVALCDSGPVPLYQRIAPPAAQMRAAGRSVSAIARHFRVDDHTAAKALRWFSRD